MIEFTIQGEPRGKARHRTTKKGHTYTPQTTVDYENEVVKAYLMEYLGRQLIEGQLSAEINAYFKIPKSATKGKKLAMKHNITRPTKKPDGDNISKIILDALNKVAYKDDSQVVDLKVKKWWSLDNPRVEVIVKKIELCQEE